MDPVSGQSNDSLLPCRHIQRVESGAFWYVLSPSRVHYDITYEDPQPAAAEALGAELAPLGIRVLNVVPGGLRTNNWTNMRLLPTAPSAHLSPLYDPDCGADASISSNEPEGVKSEGGIPDYAATRNSVIAWMNAQSGTQPGDPATAARAILDVVRSEGAAANKRDTFPDMGMLALGSDAEKNIREKCERVMRNLDEWQDVVRSIDIKEKAKR